VEQYVTRKRFSDFGQYREELRGWDTEAVQVSRGPLSMQVDSLDVGDLILMHLKINRDTIFKSARDSGWCTLIVHMTPKRWCGIDLPPGSFHAIAPRRETNVVSRGDWESINITVRRDTLPTWEAPLCDLGDRDRTPEESIFDSDPGGRERFRHWVGALFSAAMPACTEDDSAMWVAAIRGRLQRYLLAVMGHRPGPRPVSSVHRVARYDLALAALRMIQPEAERRITVSDLAQGLGVSARALEYAFSSVIGMSPAQYILAERLNKARNRLMTFGSSGETVTTVAFDHQFENLSRFAQQYARLFGERPSDTLRMARSAFSNA